MIDVEQRALCSLEQHGRPADDRAMDSEPDIFGQRQQTLSELLQHAERVIDVGSLCSGRCQLDVLDGRPEICICTGYKVKGRTVTDMPQETNVFASCEAVYETWAGWTRKTTGVNKYRDLPREARRYLARLEELAECPIDIISTGSKRDETVVVRNPLLRPRLRAVAHRKVS